MMLLDENQIKVATLLLCEKDLVLRKVFETYGFPPLWARKPEFSTLIHIILEQQVSLASANAAFTKLKALLNDSINPDNFLSLNDLQLREIGFSKQKTTYCRLLAQAIINKKLDLSTLHTLPDELVKSELIKNKGIGDWTADIYLSECLLRPDVLPKGDIAMLEAYRILYQHPKRPTHDEFMEGTAHWRPWRSVGTRLLWHYYLRSREK
ncbi:MAG: DNA-3-methyladenine glycosylase 2 family protein [Bacteroidetes bacterium]|nr:DNA-3-methyladenine glycosylase 2 family protein [Bacteroidota bacterium]